MQEDAVETHVSTASDLLRGNVDRSDGLTRLGELVTDRRAKGESTSRNASTDDGEDQSVFGSRRTALVTDEILNELGHGFIP
jgi:hypothetical protein